MKGEGGLTYSYSGSKGRERNSNRTQPASQNSERRGKGGGTARVGRREPLHFSFLTWGGKGKGVPLRKKGEGTRLVPGGEECPSLHRITLKKRSPEAQKDCLGGDG